MIHAKKLVQFTKSEEALLLNLDGIDLRYFFYLTIKGSFFDPKTMSPEEVAKKWSEINDFSRNNDYPSRPDETFSKIMEYRESIKPKL